MAVLSGRWHRRYGHQRPEVPLAADGSGSWTPAVRAPASRVLMTVGRSGFWTVTPEVPATASNYGWRATAGGFWTPAPASASRRSMAVGGRRISGRLHRPYRHQRPGTVRGVRPRRLERCDQATARASIRLTWSTMSSSDIADVSWSTCHPRIVSSLRLARSPSNALRTPWASQPSSSMATMTSG